MGQRALIEPRDADVMCAVAQSQSVPDRLGGESVVKDLVDGERGQAFAGELSLLSGCQRAGAYRAQWNIALVEKGADPIFGPFELLGH